jgi:hypothetical protein
VHCEACERPLTGSWSKSRTGGYYAYYHCQRQCRAVNASKAVLKGQFMELLAEVQPAAGFIRSVKEHVLAAWRSLRQDTRNASVSAEHRVQTVPDRRTADAQSALSRVRSPATSASFFARVHRLSCRSRFRAASRLVCVSEYARATGLRRAVNELALPS